MRISTSIDATCKDFFGDVKCKNIGWNHSLVLKSMLDEAGSGRPSQKLELIDTIQRLGLSYHFEDEIGEILKQVKEISTVEEFKEDDLHSLSLWFRLLRQEGYNMSSDIFKKFTDNDGKFKDEVTRDIQGMLSLYESAHLMVHGEPLLEEALLFSTVHLQASITTTSSLGSFLAAQVKHALEQPIRKGLPRVEARHFISIYHEDPSHSEVLLNLAKLDFNIVQRLHQKELSELTRWWKNLEIESKLSYVRDRMVEGYFWIAGVYYEPKYYIGRRIMFKIISLTSIVDDTYDAFGTIEELKQFTDAVHRWDISCLDELPNYMKQIYELMLDTYDEIEELLEARDSYGIQYAKDQMKILVQCYFDEAEWLHNNYVPTVEEYMQLSVVSCGYFFLTIISFLGMGDIVTKEAFEWASKYPKVVLGASVICRLMDDIVGHKFEQKRGHVASSVECYVKQYGASEKEAYTEFRKRIEESWKDINEEFIEPRAVPMPLLTRIINLTRVMDVLYKDKDNYTHAEGLMKDLITSLFVESIPM